MRRIIALALLLSLAAAADFTITTTGDFDAGTKSNSLGSYDMETYTDNLRIADGTLAFGSAYSDRFTFADADANTQKWYPTSYGDVLTGEWDINTTVAGKLHFRTEYDNTTTPGGYVDVLTVSNTMLSGDFDVETDFSDYSVEANDAYVFFGVFTTNDASTYSTCAIGRSTENGARDEYYTIADIAGAWEQNTTTDTSGRLRVTRATVGSTTTFNYYYWAAGAWTLMRSIPIDNTVYTQADDDLYVGYWTEATDAADEVVTNFDEFKVSSGTLVADAEEPYSTSGNWQSAVQAMASGKRLSNTTITYSGVDANNYIDEVEWLVGGVEKANYTTDITSGTSITITSPTGGSFANVSSDFTIRVYLLGSGSATPVVEEISGNYETIPPATITAIASGAWGSAGTWDLGRAPVAGDTVVITSGYTVDMDQAGNPANLTIGSGSKLNTNGYTLNVTMVTSLTGTLNASSSALYLGVTTGTDVATLTLGTGFTFIGGSGAHAISSISGWNAASGTFTFTSGVTTITSKTGSGVSVGIGFGSGVTMTAPTGSTQNFTRAGDQGIYSVGSAARTFYNLEKWGSGTLRPYGVNFNLTAYTLKINSGTTFSTATATGGGAGYFVNITKSGSANDCDGLNILGTFNGEAANVYAGSTGYAGVCYDANGHATVRVASGGVLNGGSGAHTYGGVVLLSGGAWNLTSGTTYLNGYGNTYTVIYYTGTPNITGIGTVNFTATGASQGIQALGTKAITFPGNVVVSKAAAYSLVQGAYSATYVANVTINGNLVITQGGWSSQYSTGFGNLTVLGSTTLGGGGTFNFSNATVTLQALTITGGTIATTRYKLVENGDFNMTGGTVGGTWGVSGAAGGFKIAGANVYQTGGTLRPYMVEFIRSGTTDIRTAFNGGTYVSISKGTTVNTNDYAFSVPSGSLQMALYGSSGYATLNCGNSTVLIATQGSSNWYSGAVFNGGTGSHTIYGTTFTLSSGANFTATSGTTAILTQVYGQAWTNNAGSIFNANGGTFVFNASNTKNFTMTLAAGQTLANVVVGSTATTDPSYYIATNANITGNVTVLSKTVMPTANNRVWGNVNVSGVNGSLNTNNYNMTVGSLSMTAGTVNMSNTTVSLLGNWTTTGGSLLSTNSTLAIGGTSYIASASRAFDKIAVASSATARAQDAFDFSSLSLATGSITGGSAYNFTINNTRFDALSATNAVVYPVTATLAADPAPYRNMSKYMNITNTSSSASANVTMYYSDSDWSAAGIGREITIGMWKHNGSAWLDQNGTLNNESNYIFKALSSFSPFGLFGMPPQAPSVPTLLSPTSGSTAIDTTPTLDWSDSTDPDEDPVTYDLLLWPASGFNITTTWDFDAGTKSAAETGTDYAQVPGGAVQLKLGTAFSDNFEGTPGSNLTEYDATYTVVNAGSGSSRIDGTQAYSGSSSVKMDVQEYDNYFQQTFTAPTEKRVYAALRADNDSEVISSMIVLDSTASEWSYVGAYVGIVDSDSYYFSGEPVIFYFDGASFTDSSLRWAKDTWYLFKIEYNDAAETYSAWVKGGAYSDWTSVCTDAWYYDSGSYVTPSSRLRMRAYSPANLNTFNAWYDNYKIGGHYTAGDWMSAPQTMPAGARLNDTTIAFSGVDADNNITAVEWLVGGLTEATYEAAITSGTNITITEDNLTSGSFANVDSDFTAIVYLSGNGSATPVVEGISGTYALLSKTGLATSTYTINASETLDYAAYAWKVRAYDGTNYSAWSDVWNFTVVPRNPEISGQAIAPAHPLVTNGLSCSWVVTDYDPVDTLYANVTWYRNGENDPTWDLTDIPCTNGTTCDSWGTGPTQPLTAGDQWICAITAYDSYGLTDQENATVSVLKPLVVWYTDGSYDDFDFAPENWTEYSANAMNFTGSCGGAVDFLVTTASEFDSGTKSSSEGDYETETYTDNLRVEDGALALGSKYSDRFTFDDADGDTWKWGFTDYSAESYPYAEISSGMLNLGFVAVYPDTNGYGYGNVYLKGVKLTGDFDVQADFSGPSYGAGYDIYPGICAATYIDDWYTGQPDTFFTCMLRSVQGAAQDNYYTAADAIATWTNQATADSYGKLRITRATSGENTDFAWYYWDSGGGYWAQLASASYNNTEYPNTTSDLYLFLQIDGWIGTSSYTASMYFDELDVTSGAFNTSAYRTSGSWESASLPIGAGIAVEGAALTYKSDSPTACVDSLQWLVGGVVEAEYNASLCGYGPTYQEDATENSLLSFNWNSEGYVYDGDWGTYGYSAPIMGGGAANHYMNYTKPDGALPTSVWKVKDANGEQNLTLPAECWDGMDKLRFKVVSNKRYVSKKYYYSATWSCFDQYGTESWLAGTLETLDPAQSYVYEDAMYWDADKIVAIGEGNLTSGTFADVNTDFTVKAYLSGDGSATPLIKSIGGSFLMPERYVFHSSVDVNQSKVLDKIWLTDAITGVWQLDAITVEL